MNLTTLHNKNRILHTEFDHLHLEKVDMEKLFQDWNILEEADELSCTCRLATIYKPGK